MALKLKRHYRSIQLENAKGFVESKENEQYDDLHGNQLENTAMLDNEMYAHIWYDRDA